MVSSVGVALCRRGWRVRHERDIQKLRPELELLAAPVALVRGVVDGGVDHDQLPGRVDEDGLAAYAEGGELRLGARGEPGLVAVAVVGRRGADLQVRRF